MLIMIILAGAAAVALVLLSVLVTRRWGRPDGDPDGATASHAGAMLSALFLLIFAIALILPWSAADEERKNTAAEAQALVEAYWDTAVLTPAERTPVRDGIRDYLKYVSGTEFPRLADGAQSLGQEGWRQLDAIRLRLAGLNLSDQHVSDTRDDAVERLREAYAARRERSVNTGPILPSGVLLFTVLTGLIMMVYPFLAGARPRGMPLVALCVMAALLGVSVYLVFDIDHAFTGPLSVGSSAFSDALQEIARVP